MITIAKGQKTLTRFTFSLPVLQRHFHRHFHRYGTGVCEKNALQGFWRHRHQFAAQLDGWRMGNAAKHHMRHSINLRLHCCIKLRVIVTVDCCPPGRHTVNQASAVRQNQLATFRTRYRINRQRGGYGCVWVPDMALVKGKIVRCHNRLVNQIEKI